MDTAVGSICIHVNLAKYDPDLTPLSQSQNSNSGICRWKNRRVKQCQEGVDSGQFTFYWVWYTWLASNPIEMVKISTDTSILCFKHDQELEMQVLDYNAWKFRRDKDLFVFTKKKERKENLDLVWLCLNYSSLKQPMMRAFLFKSLSQAYILPDCKHMTPTQIHTHTRWGVLERKKNVFIINSLFFMFSLFLCAPAHSHLSHHPKWCSMCAPTGSAESEPPAELLEYRPFTLTRCIIIYAHS